MRSERCCAISYRIMALRKLQQKKGQKRNRRLHETLLKPGTQGHLSLSLAWLMWLQIKKSSPQGDLDTVSINSGDLHDESLIR